MLHKVLGLDTGMRNMGVSVVSTSGKVVYTAHIRPILPAKFVGLYWLPVLLEVLFKHKPDALFAESVHYGGKLRVSGLLSLCPMLGTIRDAWLLYAMEFGKSPVNGLHVVTPASARQAVLGKGSSKKNVVEAYYLKLGLGKEKALSSHEYDATLLADYGLRALYNKQIRKQK